MREGATGVKRTRELKSRLWDSKEIKRTSYGKILGSVGDRKKKLQMRSIIKGMMTPERQTSEKNKLFVY